MKEAILTLLFLLTCNLQTKAQESYYFDRIEKEEVYPGTSIPHSDTLISGVIHISNSNIAINQEDGRLEIIENTDISPNSTEFITGYNNGTHKRYFLNLEKQEFIILDVGLKTIYKIRQSS